MNESSAARAQLPAHQARANSPIGPRFLTLADLAEELNISGAQAYALVRSGELRAVKIGGRGQWRIEITEVERYIAQMYEQTARFVSTHPF